MSEGKDNLIKKKNRLESQIEQQIENLKENKAKLKVINEEIKNIELREKANVVDQLIDSLKSQGVSDIETLINFVNQGKLNVGGEVQ